MIVEDAPADRPIPMRDAHGINTTVLPRRFYAKATLAEIAADAFGVHLDGKLAKTPGKEPLAVPSRALAARIVAEWAAQAERINPATMPLTRLVNTAIDGVTGREAEVTTDMLRYAASDLLCYRMAYPAGHAALQKQRWDPVVDWVRTKLDLHFEFAEGVTHVTQPAATLQRLPALLAGVNALELTALHTITTLTGSAILMLALRANAIDADAGWAAAMADEDWQISQWGLVDELAARRQERQAAFHAACSILAALR